VFYFERGSPPKRHAAQPDQRGQRRVYWCSTLAAWTRPTRTVGRTSRPIALQAERALSNRMASGHGPNGRRRAGRSTRPSCRSVRAEPSGKSALGRRAALALRSRMHGDVHAAISYAKAGPTAIRWMYEGAIDPPELGFVLLMRDPLERTPFRIEVEICPGAVRASEQARAAVSPHVHVSGYSQGLDGGDGRSASHLNWSAFGRVLAASVCSLVSAASSACWCGRGRCRLNHVHPSQDASCSLHPVPPALVTPPTRPAVAGARRQWD
jgi:hypothetical protein